MFVLTVVFFGRLACCRIARVIDFFTGASLATLGRCWRFGDDGRLAASESSSATAFLLAGAFARRFVGGRASSSSSSSSSLSSALLFS